jgi:hypothetical protein
VSDMGSMYTLGAAQPIGVIKSYQRLLSRSNLTIGERKARSVLTESYSQWTSEQSKGSLDRSSTAATLKSLSSLGKHLVSSKFQLGVVESYRDWTALPQPSFEASSRAPELKTTERPPASATQINYLNDMLRGCPAAFLEGLSRATMTAAVSLESCFMPRASTMRILTTC